MDWMREVPEWVAEMTCRFWRGDLAVVVVVVSVLYCLLCILPLAARCG